MHLYHSIKNGVKCSYFASKQDAAEIYSYLFEAAAICINDLDEISSQLRHVTDSDRDRVSIPKCFHGKKRNSDKPIWQTPWRIPPLRLEEVKNLMGKKTKDEVIKQSKSTQPSSIALVTKSDGSVQLGID